MSVNRARPHLYVLPEDDAARQLAVGFDKGILTIATRQMQIMPPLGGWEKVIKCFQEEYSSGMEGNPNTNVVLLIDFDSRETRLGQIREQIPQDLRNRVFILGVWSEPEDLKRDLRLSFETIGQRLAKSCEENSEEIWNHSLLLHNAGELERLRKSVRPMLFPSQ